MTTRTKQPAGGALLIAELKEFASFPKATQRYIRRSLDIGFGRADPIDIWARDDGEAASIRAQGGFYKQIDHLRVQIPDDSGLDMIEPFLGTLVTLAAFDLGQDRLPSFAAFRFLYERCRSRVRPCFHGSAPRRRAHLRPKRRVFCNRSAKARDCARLVEPRAVFWTEGSRSGCRRRG